MSEVVMVDELDGFEKQDGEFAVQGGYGVFHSTGRIYGKEGRYNVFQME